MISILAEVEVKMPSSIFAIEGEKLKIICLIQGNVNHTSIEWEYRTKLK